MTQNLTAADARSYRLDNIDMLRGLVVVIMALDHVRDFTLLGTGMDPMQDPDVTLAVYLTRWVTHFCAPVFIFLAGTSAGLMRQRKTSRELAGFLLKRGIWLVLVEAIIVSTAWTFAPLGMAAAGGAIVVVLQVIWAIGASMILLAGVQFLGARVCLLLGLLLVCGLGLLEPLWPVRGSVELGADSPLALWFYPGTLLVIPFFITENYPVLPWFGVMLLGFGSARVFQLAPAQRDRQLLLAGIAMLVVFALLRALNGYGDSNHWAVAATPLATAMDFMNLSKYPPSLLYLLATLGPMAIVCSRADRMRGWLKNVLVIFGRTPFAFYVAHLYLIHALAVLIGVAQGFSAAQMLTASAFFPAGYGVGLATTYGLWLLVVLLLYPLCRAMAGLKSRRKDWWLSYL